MKIKFCGAARTVTGSQHLLNINGFKILLDCGLFQGKREESFKMNRKFIYEPAEINCVILSHAHIDHSGNLPTLYKKGFRGNIYTTSATKDLCSIMLQDSAHIQERDVEYVNKKRSKKNESLFNPLYSFEDVNNVLLLFKTVSYRQSFTLEGTNSNIEVKFYDAGHILGSAQIVIDIKENGRHFKLGFTGDLGRPNLPILKDPEFIGNVNYLISESTYGGKVHDKADSMELQLVTVLQESISRGGKIIVPAFSVGRTQEFVYTLSKLFEKEAIPKIPIFVDSPLSVNVSEVFKRHAECYDTETREMIQSGTDVFGFSNLLYIRDIEESKSLNNFNGSCIIISASGMCEAGRVLHHLANCIEDANSTVLIIGFNAQNTLGRRLVESRDVKNAHIKIFGDDYKVKAKIYVLNSFSAHADRNELCNYFNNFDRNLLENIFLVHGEPDQQETLTLKLKDMNFTDISSPNRGDEVII
jgi:metallo-beta-lactamase family protein